MTSLSGKPPTSTSPSPSLSSSPSPSLTPLPTIMYTYNIVHAYPHDTNAFTEGLAFANSSLYESTGLYGGSTLRQVDLQTGNLIQEVDLASQFFGEGITIFDDTIIQLTWQEHIAFIYDVNSLNLLGNFTYLTEGWGLTYDGSHLIMSDGSNKLYFLNSTTHQGIGQVDVHDGNTAVTNINELEYVKGDIYANIWHQSKIAIIDPQTGQVKAWIDLTGLQGAAPSNSDNVLNGIAYDEANDRLFVTGKGWSQFFEITLVPLK